jgi:hypothetical protein
MRCHGCEFVIRDSEAVMFVQLSVVKPRLGSAFQQQTIDRSQKCAIRQITADACLRIQTECCEENGRER